MATAADSSAGARPTNAVATNVTRPKARNTYQARKKLDKGHPESARGRHDGRQAEPHHVRVAAVQVGDQRGPHLLDRVASRLVQAVPASHPALDLHLAQLAQAHLRGDRRDRASLAPPE